MTHVVNEGRHYRVVGRTVELATVWVSAQDKNRWRRIRNRKRIKSILAQARRLNTTNLVAA